jgi:hypothetical protein
MYPVRYQFCHPGYRPAGAAAGAGRFAGGAERYREDAIVPGVVGLQNPSSGEITIRKRRPSARPDGSTGVSGADRAARGYGRDLPKLLSVRVEDGAQSLMLAARKNKALAGKRRKRRSGNIRSRSISRMCVALSGPAFRWTAATGEHYPAIVERVGFPVAGRAFQRAGCLCAGQSDGVVAAGVVVG